MKPFVVAAMIFASICSAAAADFGVSKFTNPVCVSADPCAVKNPDGKGYWHLCSDDRNIYTEYALSPADFKRDRKNIVFSVKKGSEYNQELWAPELHKIGGKWYIYFTAADSAGRHSLFVVSGDDPMKPFGNAKRVCGPEITGIDQTVFEYKGKLYAVYSSGDGYSCQRLFIAEMSSPWEIKGSPVPISAPEYDWEKENRPVNEGPCALQRNGKLYIVYSCSYAASDEYKMGILRFKGGDVLKPENWEKHPEPIMTGRGNLQGTGHCTFTKDGDGNDWCVFHINRPRTENERGKWLTRYLCLQPVIWINDFPTFSPVVEKPKYFKYEK